MAKTTYTQEEVDAILSRAIEQQSKESTQLTHEDLVSAAAEVGIPKSAIDAAARDIRDSEKDLTTDAAVFAEWKRRAWGGFARHFVTYALVNAMLAFINLSAPHSFVWFPIVMLGWGVGIAMQLLNVVNADPKRVVGQLRRKTERRERRNKRKDRGADFERAVDQGVRALLEMAEKRARIDVKEEEELEDAAAAPAKAERKL